MCWGLAPSSWATNSHQVLLGEAVGHLGLVRASNPHKPCRIPQHLRSRSPQLLRAPVLSQLPALRAPAGFWAWLPQCRPYGFTVMGGTESQQSHSLAGTSGSYDPLCTSASCQGKGNQAVFSEEGEPENGRGQREGPQESTVCIAGPEMGCPTPRFFSCSCLPSSIFTSSLSPQSSCPFLSPSSLWAPLVGTQPGKGDPA